MSRTTDGLPPDNSEKPWRFPTPPGVHADFEAATLCETEDRHRAATLKASPLGEAQALGVQLALTGTPSLPPFSWASSRAARVIRARVLVAALPLMREWTPKGNLFSSTVIPHGWFFEPDQMHLAHAGKMKRMFIRALERDGLRLVDARFIGRIEAALAVSRATGRVGYAFHIHGISNLAMRNLLAQLPRQAGFSTTTDVSQPVRSIPVGVGKESTTLGYGVKAFWKQRDGGGEAFPPGSERIYAGALSNDRLIEALLWLHRWTPGELVIAIGTYELRGAVRRDWY